MDSTTRTPEEEFGRNTERVDAATLLAEGKAIVLAAITKATAEDDPGAVYAPDIVEALLRIKAADAAEFIRLRSQIKKAHRDVSIKTLDGLLRDVETEEEKKSALRDFPW
jgi:hypothetical protein